MVRLRTSLLTAPVLLLVLLSIPLLAEIASDVAQDQGWTKHDLAYYMSADLVAFVRPGLVAKIASASIQGSKISVRFTLSDPKGLPLDRAGVNTPGPVTLSFIAAYIPKGQTQYTAYTTRSAVSKVNNQTITYAGTDTGGTYTANADGDYTYTFGTAVPASYDPAVTHTIGMTARRDLSEFNLGLQYANDVYSFVPNGSPVAVVRDIVRTENCNQCHDPLAEHGGNRRDTRLCVLCHQPQSIDPNTLNPVDFKVFIHKVHRGSSLPSVKAGTPYKVASGDFSTVVFPNDLRRCTVCHKGGTQSANYLTKPSRAACGSCHDDVDFASGKNHLGGPQVSDNMCATCHIPQGELEFDASILGAHTIPTESTQLPGVKFAILKVQNTGPGQKPTVTFTVTDKAGNVIDISKMASLSLNMAGPTTDYANQWLEDARGAMLSGSQYIYTFANAIPGDAKGTFAMGMEGARNITINPNTVLAQTVRDAGFNPVVYFGVTDAVPVPRRQVAALTNCNTCHGALSHHGGRRVNAPEYCVFCHNPNGTDASHRTAAQMPAESIHFKNMIHKIHTGENLTNDYTVSGTNYSGIRFPGDTRDCVKCHLPKTYQIPLPDGVLPTVTPRGYLNPTQPIAAACLACHDDKPTAAHASIMTSPALGESCNVCHGADADYALDKVHAR